MKLKRLFLLAISTIVISGCSFWRPIDDYVAPTTSDEIINHNDKNSDPIIERFDAENGDGYRLVKSADAPFTTRELYKSTEQDVLDSAGNNKILVVPVDIKGSSNAWTDKMLNKVNTVFFGESNETSWQSVSSFYKQASYGKQNITGEVAPLFHSIQTKNDLIQNKIGEEVYPDEPIVNEWMNDKSYSDLRKNYDLDSNGYIDAVVFVYNEIIDYDNGFWAWVNWNYNFVDNETNVNTFMWIGYDFIDNRDYSGYGATGIDAHTFIHECGHMMGLDDYYPYDDDVLDASGCLDMHSRNIGDENIYSKYALGWAEPYYVKTPTSVTLKIRPSAFYGDGIIINDNWNGSAYDEYIAIEFYTPKGLNYADARKKYYNNYQMYTEKGVRIYHIDSRLVEAKTKYGGYTLSYANPTKEDFEDGIFTVGPSNSPSLARLPDSENISLFKEVCLIDAKGRQHYNGEGTSRPLRGRADNDSLFKAGDSYQAESKFFPKGTKLNGGGEVGYNIKINSIDDNYASITIEKL